LTTRKASPTTGSMGEADRPAEATSNVVPLEARTRGRRTLSALPSPATLARRLAALEREVEKALGAERLGRGPSVLESLVDDSLDAWVRGRTWLSQQAAGLGSTVLGDLSLTALARWWWRIEVVGQERIPDGPVLLVVNRGSALLPYEALMGAVTLGAHEHGGRRVHPFVDEWLMELPLVGAALRALGADTVGASRVRRTLRHGDAALASLEGRDAVARPYAEAYRVGRFTRTGLLKPAIELGTPIVPVGVVGVDEVHPVLVRLSLAPLTRVVGVPAWPVTPTLVPLPTKWRLFVGDPFDVRVHHRATDANDPAVVRDLATRVRERLQGVVSDGLRRRRSLFF
jgi:1-acyl-sn-glycerol-3-phosphate acyltransferase